MFWRKHMYGKLHSHEEMISFVSFYFRSCKEPQVYYLKDEPMPYCVGDCSDTPTCGSVKVPAAHLMVSKAMR